MGRHFLAEQGSPTALFCTKFCNNSQNTQYAMDDRDMISGGFTILMRLPETGSGVNNRWVDRYAKSRTALYVYDWLPHVESSSR